MTKKRGGVFGAAGPAVPAPAEVSEADKRAFAESMVRMHEDWWARERVPIGAGGGGAQVDDRVTAAAAKMPVCWAHPWAALAI